jgi:S-adenosylmethionine/arginine decarboxylase-like enzyme
MTSVGLLLTLDYRIDELRGRIDIENERMAQLEVEGRNQSNARKALNVLERNLEAAIAQRDKVVRELEKGQLVRRRMG